MDLKSTCLISILPTAEHARCLPYSEASMTDEVSKCLMPRFLSLKCAATITANIHCHLEVNISNKNADYTHRVS
jgi:hypothetical protein